MSFLNRWAQGEFGQVQVKPFGGYSAPTIEDYRKRFVDSAKEAARKLREGVLPEPRGWYATRSPSGFVVTLRMGVKPIDAGGGRTQTLFNDAEGAAGFIEAAAQAASAGELDDALERARVKRKRRTQEIAG